MDAAKSNNGVSVRAHKGDAMTLLAFDLAPSRLPNFTGFSIRITPGTRSPYYLTNLLTYSPAGRTKNGIARKAAHSTLSAPIKNFRGVHAPATFHQVNAPFYGTYRYEVTPRY